MYRITTGYICSRDISDKIMLDMDKAIISSASMTPFSFEKGLNRRYLIFETQYESEAKRAFKKLQSMYYNSRIDFFTANFDGDKLEA